MLCWNPTKWMVHLSKMISFVQWFSSATLTSARARKCRIRTSKWNKPLYRQPFHSEAGHPARPTVGRSTSHLGTPHCKPTLTTKSWRMNSRPPTTKVYRKHKSQCARRRTNKTVYSLSRPGCCSSSLASPTVPPWSPSCPHWWKTRNSNSAKVWRWWGCRPWPSMLVSTPIGSSSRLSNPRSCHTRWHLLSTWTAISLQCLLCSCVWLWALCR